MELRRSQQSPDSVTQQQQQQQQQDSASQHHNQLGPMPLVPLMDDESANASNTHLQHHQHHHHGHLSSSSSNSSGHHTASTLASFSQAIVVKEEDHHRAAATASSSAAAAAAAAGGARGTQHLVLPPPSFLSMEQLCWPSTSNVVVDQAELLDSMSPESADLCRNLSSQLETLRSQGCSSSEGLTAIAAQHAAAAAAATAAAAAAGQSSSSSLQQQHHHESEAAAAATAPMTVIPAASSSPSLIPAAACDNNEMLKAAIVSHPHYPELVVAHMNCHKVGASPELVSQIDEIIHSFKDFQPPVTTSLGANPELDQFMVSYYSVLQKYEKEMRKTFKEAVAYCKKLEQQLRVITNASVSTVTSVESDERNEGYETSEDEESAAEVEIEVDPMAKDKELKEQLMRKYSGYISSLKHEFLKKKKKGKLPKDSRQQLLNWWTVHYKWPYPSESEKASLAESTGLDQKQINNWFINQRKRHWKPSDELNVASGQTSQST